MSLTCWAAVVERLGDAPLYRRAEVAEPGPGEVLIQVLAAGLNPVDVRTADGRQFPGPPRVPYVPGSEGVGVVVGGAPSWVGRRVRFEAARASGGAMAQLCRTPVEACIELGDGPDDALAAGLGVAGMAAWIPLVDKARLDSGESLLVLGATGVVGQLAVQIGKHRKAGRVVAAGRDPTALAHAQELGADAAVTLRGQSEDELCAEFLAAGGGPFQVVFDPIWGVPAQAALAACAPRARFMQLGEGSSDQATLRSSILRGRQLSLIGHSTPGTQREVTVRAYLELRRLASEGALQIDTESLALHEVAAAWDRQRTSPHRKLVLVPPPFADQEAGEGGP